jgi:hypothetical protein
VSVVRLNNASDFNRCACFIANADIEVGYELIIGSEQNYLRNGGQKQNLAFSIMIQLSRKPICIWA